MIAALWSNSNWDDQKGTRKRAIDGINTDYERAIEAVEDAFTTRVVPEEEKLDKENPFFAAAERGLAKVDARIAQGRAQPTAGKPPEAKFDLEALDQTP